MLGLSVTTYCGAPFMRPVWEALGGRSGRDLILNSWGVLHFDPGRRSTRRRVIVAALFASYPVWAAIGVAAGRRRRNREGGSSMEVPPRRMIARALASSLIAGSIAAQPISARADDAGWRAASVPGVDLAPKEGRR